MVAHDHTSSDLKSYDVVVNGIETTLRLSDADAAARGLTAPRSGKAKAKTPANKAGTPEGNKGDGEPVDRRAAAVAKSFGQGKPKAAKGDG